MTLHEAIEKVLKDAGHPLRASEIATILNKSKIYQKGDNSLIRSNQIYARVSKYPSYFYKDNGLFYLSAWNSSIKKTKQVYTAKNKPSNKNCTNHSKTISGNPSTIVFLVENSFTMIGTLTQLLRNGLPDCSNLSYCGVYAISIPKGYQPDYLLLEETKKRCNVIRPWSQDELAKKWVSNAEIVYYGLAGKKSFRTLSERLNDLLRHGNGKTNYTGPHKGGEILWQLKDYETFSLWIFPTGNPPEPRFYEKLILKIFYQANRKLPFANRQF
jgi:hypothetical protein